MSKFIEVISQCGFPHCVNINQIQYILKDEDDGNAIIYFYDDSIWTKENYENLVKRIEELE